MAGAAASIRQAQLRAVEARKVVLKAAGKDAKQKLIAAAAPPTGGDLKFSGAGGRKKLGVTVSLKQGRMIDVLTIKPQKKTAGMWAWANTGTKAGSRQWRGRRKGSMSHPGTSGVGAWTKTTDPLVSEILKELNKTLSARI